MLQLAQDLEWLGCELEHYGHQHAVLGRPESGPVWDTFCEKRRGVLVTADKIERELKFKAEFSLEKSLPQMIEQIENVLPRK